MKQAYVYLLMEKNSTRFKIGKANNPSKRAIALTKGGFTQFDLRNSYQICCDPAYVFRLEQILHFLFSDYKDELATKKDGYTEWFATDCFQNVLNILYTIDRNTDGKINVTKGIKHSENADQKTIGDNNEPKRTKRKSNNERESDTLWDNFLKLAKLGKWDTKDADLLLNNWIYINFKRGSK